MQFMAAEIDTPTPFSQVAFNHLPGLRREFADAGVARLSLRPRADLTNSFHSVHGGVLTLAFLANGF